MDVQIAPEFQLLIYLLIRLFFYVAFLVLGVKLFIKIAPVLIQKLIDKISSSFKSKKRDIIVTTSLLKGRQQDVYMWLVRGFCGRFFVFPCVASDVVICGTDCEVCFFDFVVVTSDLRIVGIVNLSPVADLQQVLRNSGIFLLVLNGSIALDMVSFNRLFGPFLESVCYGQRL